MRIRRCKDLWLEPRETAHVDLEALLSGATGVVTALRWFAHAPPLGQAVEVDFDDVRLLGGLSPGDWSDAGVLRARHGAQRVRRLLLAGLLIGSTKPWATRREADERYRAMHWHGLAATWHAASRWQGEDGPQGMAEAGVDTADGLRDRHGAPPPAMIERAPASERIAMPPAPRDSFDEVLDARTTCRNFDGAALLPLELLSRLLARAFGARGELHAADDFDVVKKTSPSGGALHPTECYLVAQRVQGLAPGLYHYHVGAHALEPLPMPADFDIAAFARVAVAGQHWFANAPVLCVLVPRFGRNFWKYRNHPKAYRVCILDAGHLSQTLQLCATREGLGSFVTAAINEVDIEDAFGLTGIIDGPLAVCGFGARAETMQTYELDPHQKAWPRKAGVAV